MQISSCRHWQRLRLSRNYHLDGNCFKIIDHPKITHIVMEFDSLFDIVRLLVLCDFLTIIL